jgi:3-oxoacyl-[acyl-carrier-protein] synthase II
MSSPRDVIITGIGVVTSLGEGIAAQFETGAPRIDTATFAPYQVHPAVAVELDRHIPKKADQRQMEPWQRLGTYAAGAALEDAGLKGRAEMLAKMHLIVACGGGERDYAVDGSVLTGLRSANNPGVYLNERLMSDIRPTLFLAQLSNLLAGNISIVHGVIGGSRTFMGEEQAGVDALRIAEARIRSGQNDLFLVGGATNAERPDLLLIYEMAGLLWKRPWLPVDQRSADGGGFVPGTAAVFLVLESRAHAEARGARPIAALAPVQATRTRRRLGDVTDALAGMAAALGPHDPATTLVYSGATGLAPATVEERAAITRLAPKATPFMTGDRIGHTVEAQFPFGVAMAAEAVRQGVQPAALVTSVGHHRGEGMTLVIRA